MKTTIVVILISSFFMLSIHKSFSQFAMNEQSKSFIPSTISSADEKINTPELNTAVKNIKVERSFINYFGENAENNWSEVGKDFLNRFHVNGVLTNALFSKDGYLIYLISYGYENNLPADLRKLVKSTYYDYQIAMAIEVQENKRDIWVIKLDNETEQITIRIENGEMEQVQKFIKVQ